MTAARETEEETGWRPSGTGEQLISFQPMPGMVDTPHEVYLFRGAGHVAWVPISDVVELAKRGKVAGSGSLVGLLYLVASRGLQD